ncbi:hypothetical protein SAPIO_CDS9105 [Scedosporium apiospermum]|uniref:Zn(2)-C6 fungal-type domain-containing protein n=1 Tax=Pseudallescheria apiosperma TaxID=563466 RepID=A0A084FYD0_PSEDA|nr:uncharacterized protein SAPIO_CDS9105 [Scedosporium apiospermum]KEZ40092.1 hypothetical protein SAPIO_CDS9105 [Scedosporium apiospermum]
MTPPVNRKKKFHRRSRNGCVACRKRHIRCDETKPFCTWCLQKGTLCEYQEDSGSEAQAKYKYPALLPKCSVSDMTPNHQLAGYAVEMPAESRWLFHQFSTFAFHAPKGVERGQNNAATLSNPSALHASLVLSACQLAWITDSVPRIKVAYYYHKAAAYRAIREQVSDPSKATSDLNLTVIAMLGTAEPGLPQRMIAIARDNFQSGKNLHLLSNIVHDTTLLGLVSISAYPDPSTNAKGGDGYRDTCAQPKTPGEQAWVKCVKLLDQTLTRRYSSGIGNAFNRHVDSSKTAFITLFMYLYAALPQFNLEPALTFWLLEQMSCDVEDKEYAMVAGIWSSQFWIWAVMFGAAVASACKVNAAAEEKELRKWRAFYDEKMRFFAETIKSRRWQDIRCEIWQPESEQGFNLDDDLRMLWVEAVGVEDETWGTLPRDV